MIWRIHIAFTVYLVTSVSLFGQERSEIIQQRIEFISEQLESEDIDLTNVIEQLNYYFDNKINLNNAQFDQLEELNLLTDVQIYDLLLHIKLYGKLISVYELQSLKYWDLETIRLVMPFVKVDDKLDNIHITFKEAMKEGKFEWFLRYQTTPQEKNGYSNVPDSILQSSNSFYYGNADRYYSRLRYSYKTNISIGLTAEKDPGETFFKGANKNGFDFYSAHAFFKGGKYVRAVALGDYQVQIGQGVNFWSGYAFGKTADVTNVKKTAQPLRPYTSVDEARFMRGAAVETGYKSWSLLTFGSMKKLDGSAVQDSILDDLEFISSINLSGLHRTNSEISRKNTLTEYIGGGNLKFRKRAFSAGVAAVYQGYDKVLSRDTLPYNQFDFRGDQMMSISGDYNLVKRNFNFFGESSFSTYNKVWAHLHGVLFSMDSRASFALVYRNYDRAYQTFYNAGFAEGSQTQNEKGIYFGTKLKLNSSWSINAYADVFSFPWMKYQVDAPSAGHEIMIQPTYKPNKQLEIYGRYRQQLRQKNSRNEFDITPIEDVQQRNYRINLSYAVSEFITIKSRIEYVTIDRLSNEKESGMIFTQDVLFKPKSFPLDVSLRYALFDTDSYDTRIYTYENNALYTFAVPAYYYRGSRAYVLVRYSFLRKFDLWVRYGNFIYANRTSIGSGAEEIKGSVKSDITVQLRISF
ncbi:MAG: hypothetical protein EP305_10370 [Bacteroidetes bacterium]|nr:MAG: hypothetical protein EP305_10370 [Bacteroidota bacterium]